jgi:hypothetical protein
VLGYEESESIQRDKHPVQIVDLNSLLASFYLFLILSSHSYTNFVLYDQNASSILDNVTPFRTTGLHLVDTSIVQKMRSRM